MGWGCWGVALDWTRGVVGMPAGCMGVGEETQPMAAVSIVLGGRGLCAHAHAHNTGGEGQGELPWVGTPGRAGRTPARSSMKATTPLDRAQPPPTTTQIHPPPTTTHAQHGRLHPCRLPQTPELHNTHTSSSHCLHHHASSRFLFHAPPPRRWARHHHDGLPPAHHAPGVVLP